MRLHISLVLLVTAAILGHQTLASDAPQRTGSVKKFLNAVGLGKKDKYANVPPPSDPISVTAAAGVSSSSSLTGTTATGTTATTATGTTTTTVAPPPSLREHGLPAIVRKIMLKVQEMCMNQDCVGVYRLSGLKPDVDKVIKFIQEHQSEDAATVHSVAIPEIKFQDLTEGVKNYLFKRNPELRFFVAGVNREEMMKELSEAIAKQDTQGLAKFLRDQPEKLREALSFILGLLAKITKNPSAKMEAKNFGVVWGPVVLSESQTNNLEELKVDMTNVPSYFENLINFYIQRGPAALGLPKPKFKQQAQELGVKYTGKKGAPVSE